MISTEFDAVTSILSVTMTGEITAEEYRDVLIPAIDAATADGARVKMLAALPEGISGFSAGAALEDARMGLKHWSGFDRVAVLADAGALTGALHFFSVLMPCPVKPFPVDQADDARRWLEESLGAIHQTDLGEGVLHVQFVGQLDRAAYEGEGGDIDQFIRKNSRFRLIVDLREFDGWQGIGGLTEHIKTLKGRAALVERVAIVAGADWHKMVAGVGRHMLKAEVEVFENFDAAKDWVSS